MTFVTVFRRIPKPITGMIGVLYDPEFTRFEATLDWLETTGVLVEQFDPSTGQQEAVKRRRCRRSWRMKANGLRGMDKVDRAEEAACTRFRITIQ